MQLFFFFPLQGFFSQKTNTKLLPDIPITSGAGKKSGANPETTRKILVFKSGHLRCSADALITETATILGLFGAGQGRLPSFQESQRRMFGNSA